MDGLDRRGFMRTAGLAVAGLAVSSAALAKTYDVNVDASLFETINRIKDPEKPTGTELHHAPYITVPDKVAPGKPFMVDVSVGRELHAVSANHRITEVTLLAGNEPVGTVVFTSLYAQPRAAFLVSVDKPITLVAQARCNLHGLWEAVLDVKPE